MLWFGVLLRAERCRHVKKALGSSSKTSQRSENNEVLQSCRVGGRARCQRAGLYRLAVPTHSTAIGLSSSPSALGVVPAQQHQLRASSDQIPEFQRTATMRRVAIGLLALVGAAEAFVAPQPTAAPLTVVAGRADLCSNHEEHRRFIEALT